MTNNLKTTLIISTYNWEEALELVFLSLLQQTEKPDEVIVADDGSREKTKQLVDKYQKIFSFSLIHVWHENKGFRLAKIRNEAIKKATNEYIIQIDGDIILHKDFVKDHKKTARKGYFISGSRVLLGPNISSRLLSTISIDIGTFSPDTTNKHYSYRIPIFSKILRKPSNDIQKVIRSVRGCNMSFWKKNLIKINGYNEDMIGWGREDSEISARLINIGLSKINLKFSGIQYHIYHKIQSKKGLNTNDVILDETVGKRKKFTQNGIDKSTKKETKNKVLITAIIPTLNEETNIEAAIQTVQFADEIIVIDSLSTDNTVAIAEKLGVKVIHRAFDNFSNQKNHAIKEAQNDWIYVLDADERVSSELRNEITSIINQNTDNVVAYETKMNYYFMGKLMKHSSLKTKKVYRLFNKKFCIYDGKPVHEQLKIDGKKGSLKNLLDHKSDKSIDDFIKTQSFYADLKAEELFQKDDKNLFVKALFKPPFRFVKHFIIQLGFLDGFQGLVFSGVQSYGVFIRYVKLWKLNRKK